MSKNTKFLPEVTPILLLIISVVLFFSKIIISGNPLYGSDFALQFYQWKKFIYDYIRIHGALPLWNPYLFSGTPFIANIQASMFYPLGFLYYLVPPESAYGYSTIIHCMLGSIFMYAFMRTLSVSRGGSFFSAIIFTFNGFFMAHLYAGHLSFVQNYIWIPLIFHLLYRFIQEINLKYAVAAGLIFGIQILGGFPQIAFYTILGILGFGLFHMVVFLKSNSRKNAFRLGLGLVVISCTGFALAAVQVLPTMEFTRLSTRAGGLSYAFATYDSLNPKGLLSFLIPDIFGNVVDQTYWRSPGEWHFWETCGYVGILPLFFIFTKTESPLIRRLRIFFIILILLSLFLALGKHNPLYSIVYRLPGFNRFRIPAQIIFLYIFGIAVVCGIGMHRMQEDGWQFNRGFVLFFAFTGILLLLLVVSLSFFPYHLFFHLFKNFSEGPITHINMGRLYDRIFFSIDKVALLFFGSALIIFIRKSRRLNLWAFNIIVLGIVIIDLFLFSGQFIKHHEFRTSPTNQNILAHLTRSPDQGRVVTISDLFTTNGGLRYRFPSILGYDPLILRRYVYYIQSSQGYQFDDHVVNLSGINNPGAKLLKLLNVNQIVIGRQVLSLDNKIPYANIVKNAVLKPFDEILPLIKSSEFDPHKMVVFEPEYRSKLFPQTKSETFEGSCSILDYDNESIRIKTSSNQPGYLVLSEIFYPGWQAKVDGEKAPILCGNYLFRVIPLDKGEHEVYLHFVSWPFRIGLVISLLSLAGSLWLIIRKSKDGKRLRFCG